MDGQDVLRDGRVVFTLPPRRTLSAALLDREGSLWLGTDAGGLHRLKPALFSTYGLAEGVGHPNVYATYVDRAGAIWLGTWGNGATRLDPATGRVTVLGAGTVPHAVNSFHEDGAGRLWIGGGERGGLCVCSPPPMRCGAEGPRELRERAVFALHWRRRTSQARRTRRASHAPASPAANDAPPTSSVAARTRSLEAVAVPC